MAGVKGCPGERHPLHTHLDSIPETLGVLLAEMSQVCVICTPGSARDWGYGWKAEVRQTGATALPHQAGYAGVPPWAARAPGWGEGGPSVSYPGVWRTGT